MSRYVTRDRVGIAAAVAGPLGGGGVAAAVVFDFFFTVPYERFSIAHSSDVTTFVLLFAVGVAVSQLAARARRLKRVTVEDAGHLARILDSAGLTQPAGSPDAVGKH